jgi:hypothetical protein
VYKQCNIADGVVLMIVSKYISSSDKLKIGLSRCGQ